MKNVAPKKHLGQHFLKDKNIARKLADLVLAVPRRNILEIGPGTGVLTEFLLHPDKHLELIELDQESVSWLLEHYPQLQDHVHFADFLHVDLNPFFGGAEFVLCGNYPYNISSQIIFRMIENRERIPFMAGMFQLELAQRLASPPGSKVYGIVSVLLQSYYSVKLEFKIPPGVFFPPPKVDSAVISCHRLDELPDCSYQSLAEVVKAAFGQRRKTLGNALRKINLPLREMLPEHLLNLRAEVLSVVQFQEMAVLLDELKRKSN